PTSPLLPCATLFRSRKVGAPDRSLKDHVADDRELRRRMVKDDMPRRVPRTVDDVDFEITDRHLVAIDQPAVGLERLAHHTEARAILGETLDPEPVILVRPLDRHAQFLREHPRLPAMIHMAMGDED